MEKLPESCVRVTLEIPGTATKAAYDKVCTELSKTIELPGFRKGSRIPPQVLEQAMSAKGGRNALKTQAINTLLSELIESALREDHGLEPIGQPALETAAEELSNSFKPGDDFEMAVKCDVWPDIQWKKPENAQDPEKPYLGLKGTYTRKPFDKAKMDKAVLDLQERYTELATIEDKEYELKMGDACRINMEGYMANADGGKGEKLPDAASGDNVEVVLGEGRYMAGLVEGLLGAKVSDTKEITVTFPDALRDKTLAGKTAVFDVTVLEAQTRTLPEIDDEFAKKVRADLTAESLKEELQKAVDQEDAKEYVPNRNAALAKALAQVMDVEVPDTLVSNQARDKFAMMMSDMRSNGVPDEEIKKQISPENFLKYKDIVKDDIVADFKVSMATDEIARIENIEVDDSQVEEQMENIKKEAADSEEEIDMAQMRSRVEATIQRQSVMDFLAENADLEVNFVEGEGDFDEALMKQLGDEALAREQGMEGNPEEGIGESPDSTPREVDTVVEAVLADAEEEKEALVEEAPVEDTPVVEAPVAEPEVAEEEADPASEPVAEERDTSDMSMEDKAFYALLDAGALNRDDA
eukprot:CAMPEP_0197178458 /NCGR_PEP_ID=MMETSP1423-20130617/3725_1 /TAXON_ID=476441 /ORGANISM="Pseudo-nitzschia heimii, Strain UNC1101" /LENGTH=582 /DNA_ID=CAMNT_0042628205 /DNA_START=215 /DNA_END=1963 /DNA_ORIENTATION=-